ncbi:MAG: protein translocase subunit SecD [Lentisphaerae bacterium]|nr:protein translocase subunit SecD [Lentisphaerota bacterium]
MDKHASTKWLVLILMTAASLWLVTPPSEKIKLGLDLQGGSSLVVAIDKQAVEEELKRNSPAELSDAELQLQVKDAMSDAQSRALTVIRNRVDGLGIAEPIIYPERGSNRIVVQLPGADEKKRRDAVESIQRVAFLSFHLVHEKNEELSNKLFVHGIAPSGYKIVSIGENNYYKRDPQSIIEGVESGKFAPMTGSVRPPTGHTFMRERRYVQEIGEDLYVPCCVKTRQEFSGNILKNAVGDFGSLGQRYVALEFNKEGARRFAAVTTDYAPNGPKNMDSEIGRRLAVVLDDVVYSSPTIIEPIHGGKAQITGQFPGNEADKLAMVLRTGSLPAPVAIVEKFEVDPSLGRDSIRSGMRAIILGAIGVLAFMSVYYLVAGVVANIALVLNILLLPLGMVVAAGFLGTTLGTRGASSNPFVLPVLTLPGIAGILLTVGMAVDANVLIFERIREELESGKRLWASITAGYTRVFSTIIDANITTLLTGVILFIVGSGSIRGFAVTLCAGILISMFTAIVVTKLIFGVFVSVFKLETLKMFSFLGVTTIDFVGKRRIAAFLSLAIIIGSCVFMAYRGKDILGIDFVSGTSLVYTFNQNARPSVEKLRATLDANNIKNVQIQYQREMQPSTKEYLHVKTTFDKDSAVTEILTRDFPSAEFVVAQEHKVDPQVGIEMQTKAIKAIAIALIGIIIYISIRFKFGFALGAIIALGHDVLVTVGIYTLFGRQLSLPIIAALLTIVGYSVNDTIVVFDRIRENIRLIRNKTFSEVCNISINQTLNRTILTSVTTLIAVVMLLVFGGGAINDFALALCIGVIVGTYSSVFIATPIVLLWHRNKTPDMGSGNQQRK